MVGELSPFTINVILYSSAITGVYPCLCILLCILLNNDLNIFFFSLLLHVKVTFLKQKKANSQNQKVKEKKIRRLTLRRKLLPDFRFVVLILQPHLSKHSTCIILSLPNQFLLNNSNVFVSFYFFIFGESIRLHMIWKQQISNILLANKWSTLICWSLISCWVSCNINHGYNKIVILTHHIHTTICDSMLVTHFFVVLPIFVIAFARKYYPLLCFLWLVSVTMFLLLVKLCHGNWIIPMCCVSCYLKLAGMWSSFHTEANQSSAWNIWYKRRWIWMGTQGNLSNLLKFTVFAVRLTLFIFLKNELLTFYFPSFQWQPEMDTSRRRFFLWYILGRKFCSKLNLDAIFFQNLFCLFLVFLTPTVLAVCMWPHVLFYKGV